MWHTTASQALPSSPLPTSHAPPLSAALRMAPPEPVTLAPAEHRRSIANPKHHPPPRCPLMPARPPSHHRRWAEPHPTAAPLLRQSARSRCNSPPPATDSHCPPVFIAARPGPTPPRIALCNRPTSCGGESGRPREREHTTAATGWVARATPAGARGQRRSGIRRM
eukprot:scaffold10787_cov123-Isochrysis_galbana.AAC.13